MKILNLYILNFNINRILIKSLRIVLLFFLIKIVLIPFGSKDYLSNVVLKHEILSSIKENKIVVLGHSASVFGINGKLIEHQFNKRTLILGVHGGLGLLDQYNDSRKYLTNKDILIWNYSFENIQNPSILNKKKKDFIKQNPLYHIKVNPSILNFIESILFYKIGKNDYTGVYSYNNFDPTGSIILKYNRDTSLKESSVKRIDTSIPRLSHEKIVQFIKLFPQSVNSNSYFVHTPVGDLDKNDTNNINYNIRLCNSLKIKYIVSPIETSYSSSNCYYDGFPHLSRDYRDTNTVRIIKKLSFLK